MSQVTYCVSSIKFVSFCVYRVTFTRPDGAEIKTCARISVDGDSGVRLINFDSDEVGKISMKEFFDVKDVCAKISAFHKTHTSGRLA